MALPSEKMIRSKIDFRLSTTAYTSSRYREGASISSERKVQLTSQEGQLSLLPVAAGKIGGV
jgi:hypothetical protein